MKKYKWIWLIVLLVFALVGCGDKANDLATSDGVAKAFFKAYQENDRDMLQKITVGGEVFYDERDAFVESLGYEESGKDAILGKMQAITLKKVGEVPKDMPEDETFVRLDCEVSSANMGSMLLQDALEGTHGQDVSKAADETTEFPLALVKVDGQWKVDLVSAAPDDERANHVLLDLMLGKCLTASSNWVAENDGKPTGVLKDMTLMQRRLVWPIARSPEGVITAFVNAYRDDDRATLQQISLDSEAFYQGRDAFVESLGYDAVAKEAILKAMQDLMIQELGEASFYEPAGDNVCNVSCEILASEIAGLLLEDALAGAHRQDFSEVSYVTHVFSMALVRLDGQWKIDLNKIETNTPEWSATNPRSWGANDTLVNMMLGNAIDTSQEWVKESGGTPPGTVRDVTVVAYHFVWPTT